MVCIDGFMFIVFYLHLYLFFYLVILFPYILDCSFSFLIMHFNRVFIIYMVYGVYLLMYHEGSFFEHMDYTFLLLFSKSPSVIL